METIQLTIRYAGARAYQFGRRVFRSEAGALTLEWIIIAGLLVAATAAAGIIFTKAIKTEGAKVK